MVWRRAWEFVGRHRELALVLAFFGMASWELVEFIALEWPNVPTPLALALHSVQVLLVGGVAWTALRAWRERTRHEEALARMVEKVVMAQEEERRRIAFEVHDGVAQLIVSAKQHVDTARDFARRDSARADREVGRAAERLEAAIEETRRVLRALRPSAVDAVGLAEAMRRALDEAASESGWAARFVDNLGDARVPAAVETAAFRIFQESLVNVARHSHGRRVDVELSRRARWLHLEVRDDGVGFTRDGGDDRGHGLGLAGMRERARLLGGTCRIDSDSGTGTAVSVMLPLGPEPASPGERDGDD
jgi:signal transduction histidine kinase